MQTYETLTHTFAPVFDGTSRVLILGTFPSVKSRENQFYYGHPQNRFWKVLSSIMNQPEPGNIGEKKSFLLENHIALWDVIARCEIAGSSDSSIRNVTVNDLGVILDHAPIEGIFANGEKASKLYRKYCEETTGRAIVKLPSTSPANAAWTLKKLEMEWGRLLSEFLEIRP